MHVTGRTWRRRFSDAGIALLLAGASAHAEDGATRLLIDQRLVGRPVEMAGLEPGGVLVRDERGQIETLAWRDYVALAAPGEEARPTRRGSVLELVDGQRLVGSLVAGDVEDGRAGVWWDHARFGTLRVPLEDVADIVLRERVGNVPSADELLRDVVVLANGDRIEGFVERIGDAVDVDDGDGVREVPIGAVGAVVLANPRREMDGAYVWLADGSVVAISGVGDAEVGSVSLTASLADAEEGTIAESGVGVLPVRDLLAMVFDAGRLVGLGTLEPAGQSVPEERRWSEPASIGDPSASLMGAATVRLPGPMAVWWELPAGATRLAFTARLPLAMRTWGDCDLIIETGEPGSWRELVRERLDGSRPEARVNVRVDGPMLRLRVEAGRYGPIQDHVTIERGLLLLAP